MKRFHLAIGVSDIARSVEDYSGRFGQPPTVLIPDEYALWRTTHVNFSIRRVEQRTGTLRHLGWEDSSVSQFTQEADVNGIVWERFSSELQLDEIRAAWPEAHLTSRPKRSSRTRPRSVR